MLVTTCLIIAAGVITESQAWVTVAILCSSLGINILGYVFAHLSGISAYIFGMRVRWTGTAWTVLIAELLMVPPASGDDLLHPIQEDRFSLMTKAHLY
jgi:ABC-2 type transport system permease protein